MPADARGDSFATEGRATFSFDDVEAVSILIRRRLVPIERDHEGSRWNDGREGDEVVVVDAALLEGGIKRGE